MIRITTTFRPATDLGFLLHKNPGRLHSQEVTGGTGWLVFPEATEETCSAVFGVDIDPVALVRGKGWGSNGGTMDQYVNDRPYVVSSYYAVALKKFFGTAMGGRCKERPELVDQELPFEVELSVVSGQLSDRDMAGLFEPLGYEVEIERLALDETFPEWGSGRHARVVIRGEKRLVDLLNHLYVLISALDGNKHYYIDREEVEKLIRKGAGWLQSHPSKSLIVRRNLGRRMSLVAEALAQLSSEEEELAVESGVVEEVVDMEAKRAAVSLHKQRHLAVVEQLKASGARRVLDLGCGEGQLVKLLLNVPQFTKVVGMDVSYFALEKAHRRLKTETMTPSRAERLELIHGSLLYRDRRLEGFDAAAVVEVIEHLDEARLGFFEQVVFGFSRPETVVVTTPNREYNAKYEGMAEGAMRHGDHRFEWTRAEFSVWCSRVAEAHGYTFEVVGVGEEDEALGAPSQMGVFRR